MFIPFWFKWIFLVYAVIMEVKSNIKRKMNRIYSALEGDHPFLIPISTSWLYILQRVLIPSKFRVSPCFYICQSDWRPTNRGMVFSRGIFSEKYYLGWICSGGYILRGLYFPGGGVVFFGFLSGGHFLGERWLPWWACQFDNKDPNSVFWYSLTSPWILSGSFKFTAVHEIL